MSPVAPKPTIRRRRAAVLTAAGAAFILGASIGAGNDNDETPIATTSAPDIRPQTEPPQSTPTPTPTPDPLKGLSLEKQVGKLVVLRFEGTTVPTYVRRVLRNGWASGAILFKANITSPPQLKALTRSIRAAGKAGGATPIVCTDQEGGVIRNVVWAPPARAQAGQRPGQDARAAARALRKEGINVTLAPVADVPTSAELRARLARVLERRGGSGQPPRRRRSRAGAPAASPRPPSTSPASAARR